MHWFSLIFCGVLIAGFLFFVGVLVFEGVATLHSWRGPVKIVAAIVLAVGTIGFMGSSFTAIGGLDWLGSFEWPMGRATDVRRLSDGTYVVPHDPTNRIQLYDSDLRFLRAWRISASGGVFKMRVTSDDCIEVQTARTHLHVVYDARGHVLSSEPYDSRANSAIWKEPSGGQTIYIPTAWYLWPLTHPFYAWACIFAGICLANFSSRGTTGAQKSRSTLHLRDTMGASLNPKP